MIALTTETLDSWADDPNGPVALHLRQKLMPVEDDCPVIFPPTYADIGYNIDTLSDGSKVCTIDSVGSQANRMEPMFKASAPEERENPLAELVPQIVIDLHSEGGHAETLSVLDLAHRSADAVVYSSPKLAQQVTAAFKALSQRNDAWPLCCIAPTSLVFGVWDSRGDSGEKRPRVIRSIIRAWGVDVLSAAAQFNSVSKHLTDEQKTELQKEANARKTKLSEKGFADAPATFRKLTGSADKAVPQFKNGSPNPERRVLGGVYVWDRIEREVTVNLVALRCLRGADARKTQDIRRYILALTMIAATAEMDFFLRSGCQLQIPETTDEWSIVPRRGIPEKAALSSSTVSNLLLSYARSAVTPFKAAWPKELTYKFDLKQAKNLLAKKEADEADEG